MRRRRSRLRLLTLLTSQRQRSPSWLPTLSAKPVMLAKVMALASCGADVSAAMPSLSPVARGVLLPGRRRGQLGHGGIEHRHIGVPNPAACLDVAAFGQSLLLALESAIGRDILGLALDGRGKDVPALAGGDEIEIIGLF